MDYSWTCKCCGGHFETLPMYYSAVAPLNWFALPEAERETRADLDDDFCIIDNREFYVLGDIVIPVIDHPEPLVQALWISVSRESMIYLLDHWDSPANDDEPPRFGWLCNWLHGYPEPREIRCHVFRRPLPTRPRIVLEPTDYPLAVEQHQGITLERVQEIFALSAH